MNSFPGCADLSEVLGQLDLLRAGDRGQALQHRGHRLHHFNLQPAVHPHGGNLNLLRGGGGGRSRVAGGALVKKERKKTKKNPWFSSQARGIFIFNLNRFTYLKI